MKLAWNVYVHDFNRKEEANNMSLIRISESEDFVVDYDKERGMYRVSVFNDGHFQNEYWFDCYEERELGSNE